MGILLKRRLKSGQHIGSEYYHYIPIWGKSPMNFTGYDYDKLVELMGYDMDLPMVADFGFYFNNVNSSGGMTGEHKILQIPDEYRHH